MFNLFKNFITAFEANSEAESAYKAKQKKIRDAIEEDIESEAKWSNYCIEYSDYPGRWNKDEIKTRTKIEFIIEHESDFKNLGYELTYECYNYDGLTNKKIFVHPHVAQYVEVTLSWKNKGE